MTEAEKAYAEAEIRIANVKQTGKTHLILLD